MFSFLPNHCCKRHIQIACTLSKPARKILENKLNELALKCVVLKSNSQECNAEKKQTKDSKPKEIKNKQEVKEEVEHIPLSAEYRATVLSLIAKIQDIEQYYKEADYESCYDILDICSFILDDLKNEDVNRKIIQEQLDLWQERLKNLNA